MSACVTSCQSLVPRVLPSASLSSSSPVIVSMGRTLVGCAGGRTPPARGRPGAPLPRLLRAARLDHRARRQPGQRPARLAQPTPAGGRGALAAGGGAVLRRRGRDLPHRRLPGLPRPPPADARRPRDAVDAGPGAVRGARLDRPRPCRPGGRRPAALARPLRDGGRRHGADPHRRSRPLPVRDRERARAAAAHRRRRARGAGPRRGARALRHRPRAGAGLHRPARGPVRRPAGREGDRAEDRRRHPAPQGQPRARDPRGDPREAVGAPRADRAGRRAALLQGHRHHADHRPRAPRPTRPPTSARAPAPSRRWGWAG